MSEERGVHVLDEESADRFVSTLKKAPTGIPGLDEITGGGLPASRATLVCGGPGCGKTVFAMEFLIRGARQFDEPGLFVSFEESSDDLITNFRSFGFDLQQLTAAKQLHIAQIRISRAELVEAGEFSLDALFIRLKLALAETGAKRVVLDSLDTIFTNLPNPQLLRSEVVRLLSWLKEQGVTIIVTGEKGNGSLTRHGFEEYVTDSVVVFDYRVMEQMSRRRLRFLKYRGSSHGADEYPFIIGATGLSVLPITSAGLEQHVGHNRVSTGVPDLDSMFGGRGYYEGSSILISGTAGTGKSTLAASFAAGICAQGYRCLYLALEESVSQIVRNMRSVGLDLQPWIDRGVLVIKATRPTFYGVEERLISTFDLIERTRPDAFVMDPVSSFLSIGQAPEIKAMFVRLFDHLKTLGITAVFTNLTAGSTDFDNTEVGVSSLMDTWIMLKFDTTIASPRPLLRIVKSRGMGHSRDSREIVFASNGLELRTLPPDSKLQEDRFLQGGKQNERSGRKDMSGST